MKLGGERLRAQESVSKYLQYEMSGQPCLRGMRAFYSPQENLAVGGIRNPDMSGSGVGHVRPTSLKPDLGTGYVRSGT
jgi:hypothetical protein